MVAEAYGLLLGERFPLTLPFDLWLETVREFCAFAETPLHRVLETFRTSDDLRPAAPAYGWAGIFVEALGLSPDERAVFTDPNPAAWWTLYGYADEAQARTEATENEQRVDLNSARALCRRLGLTFQELVALLRSRFVNPKLIQLGVLDKLPASIAELRTFFVPANRTLLADNADLLGAALTREQQARVAALSADQWALLTDLGGFADRVRAYAELYGKSVADVTAELAGLALDEVLVLADPDAGCSFDQTILRHADATPAGGGDFVRLNLSHCPAVAQARLAHGRARRGAPTFLPAGAPFDTALVYLAHLKALDDKLPGGKAGAPHAVAGHPDRGQALALRPALPHPHRPQGRTRSSTTRGVTTSPRTGWRHRARGSPRSSCW